MPTAKNPLLDPAFADAFFAEGPATATPQTPTAPAAPKRVNPLLDPSFSDAFFSEEATPAGPQVAAAQTDELPVAGSSERYWYDNVAAPAAKAGVTAQDYIRSLPTDKQDEIRVGFRAAKGTNSARFSNALSQEGIAAKVRGVADATEKAVVPTAKAVGEILPNFAVGSYAGGRRIAHSFFDQFEAGKGEDIAKKDPEGKFGAAFADLAKNRPDFIAKSFPASTPEGKLAYAIREFPGAAIDKNGKLTEFGYAVIANSDTLPAAPLGDDKEGRMKFFQAINSAAGAEGGKLDSTTIWGRSTYGADKRGDARVTDSTIARLGDMASRVATAIRADEEGAGKTGSGLLSKYGRTRAEHAAENETVDTSVKHGLGGLTRAVAGVAKDTFSDFTREDLLKLAQEKDEAAALVQRSGADDAERAANAFYAEGAGTIASFGDPAMLVGGPVFNKAGKAIMGTKAAQTVANVVGGGLETLGSKASLAPLTAKEVAATAERFSSPSATAWQQLRATAKTAGRGLWNAGADAAVTGGRALTSPGPAAKLVPAAVHDAALGYLFAEEARLEGQDTSTAMTLPLAMRIGSAAMKPAEAMKLLADITRPTGTNRQFGAVATRALTDAPVFGSEVSAEVGKAFEQMDNHSRNVLANAQAAMDTFHRVDATSSDPKTPRPRATLMPVSAEFLANNFGTEFNTNPRGVFHGETTLDAKGNPVRPAYFAMGTDLRETFTHEAAHDILVSLKNSAQPEARSAVEGYKKAFDANPENLKKIQAKNPEVSYEDALDEFAVDNIGQYLLDNSGSLAKAKGLWGGISRGIDAARSGLGLNAKEIGTYGVSEAQAPTRMVREIAANELAGRRLAAEEVPTNAGARSTSTMTTHPVTPEAVEAIYRAVSRSPEPSTWGDHNAVLTAMVAKEVRGNESAMTRISKDPAALADYYKDMYTRLDAAKLPGETTPTESFNRNKQNIYDLLDVDSPEVTREQRKQNAAIIAAKNKANVEARRAAKEAKAAEAAGVRDEWTSFDADLRLAKEGDLDLPLDDLAKRYPRFADKPEQLKAAESYLVEHNNALAAARIKKNEAKLRKDEAKAKAEDAAFNKLYREDIAAGNRFLFAELKNAKDTRLIGPEFLARPELATLMEDPSWSAKAKAVVDAFNKKESTRQLEIELEKEAEAGKSPEVLARESRIKELKDAALDIPTTAKLKNTLRGAMNVILAADPDALAKAAESSLNILRAQDAITPENLRDVFVSTREALMARYGEETLADLALREHPEGLTDRQWEVGIKHHGRSALMEAASDHAQRILTARLTSLRRAAEALGQSETAAGKEAKQTAEGAKAAATAVVEEAYSKPGFVEAERTRVEAANAKADAEAAKAAAEAREAVEAAAEAKDAAKAEAADKAAAESGLFEKVEQEAPEAVEVPIEIKKATNAVAEHMSKNPVVEPPKVGSVLDIKILSGKDTEIEGSRKRWSDSMTSLRKAVVDSVRAFGVDLAPGEINARLNNAGVIDLAKRIGGPIAKTAAGLEKAAQERPRVVTVVGAPDKAGNVPTFDISEFANSLNKLAFGEATNPEGFKKGTGVNTKAAQAPVRRALASILGRDFKAKDAARVTDAEALTVYRTMAEEYAKGRSMSGIPMKGELKAPAEGEFRLSDKGTPDAEGSFFLSSALGAEVSRRNAGGDGFGNIEGAPAPTLKGMETSRAIQALEHGPGKQVEYDSPQNVAYAYELPNAFRTLSAAELAKGKTVGEVPYMNTGSAPVEVGGTEQPGARPFFAGERRDKGEIAPVPGQAAAGRPAEDKERRRSIEAAPAITARPPAGSSPAVNKQRASVFEPKPPSSSDGLKSIMGLRAF